MLTIPMYMFYRLLADFNFLEIELKKYQDNLSYIADKKNN